MMPTLCNVFNSLANAQYSSYRSKSQMGSERIHEHICRIFLLLLFFFLAKKQNTLHNVQTKCRWRVKLSTHDYVTRSKGRRVCCCFFVFFTLKLTRCVCVFSCFVAMCMHRDVLIYIEMKNLLNCSNSWLTW